ncbi:MULTISPECIES: gamma-glutamyltransferase family protein [Hyphomonas]|uniref:Gamma-glutamyltranspeptidase n=2 Tax=Hyphomonas adhaerens TaxID=81029 RepID=A0A3B9H1F7_9PROT|nr:MULTISPECIES: gamma-glutamyltransferase family protein [Hyphomonas]MBB41967.1 gamma-glutamyltranspeptidase [Hyphomonas sp.]HAE28094.1 gamma-glutamyltranspeptidase [Hyphomonas adhaerens]|tara:strand:- start:6177 stop:8108 length:1932 start_codon:yes stop_codon:yes gene_type:complete
MKKQDEREGVERDEPVEAAAAGLDRRHFLTAGALVASGVAAACVSPVEPVSSTASASEPPTPPDAPESGDLDVASHRVETPGPHGVVSAGHPLAASAGLRMFMQGGAAGDAAVATMAVLNLVEPWASSIAGNGFATVYDKPNGQVKALKFGGAAPLALDPKSDPTAFDWGVKAATTPGAFDGWIELLRQHGRLSLANVFAPAIDLARNGHPIDPSIARIIEYMQGRLQMHPTTAEVFLPGGRVPAPRQMLTNENLAKTFESLVAEEQKVLAGGGDRDTALLAAREYFYNGPIADELDRFFRSVGGWLRKADLAAYKAEWADPVKTTYRGYEVYSTPPTSRGGLEVCMQANLVERFDVSGLKPGSAQLLHLQAEAIKHAKADIYAYAADPKYTEVPVSAMLSKAYAKDRSAMIDPSLALPFPNVTDFRRYDPSAPAPPASAKRTPDDEARFSDTTSLTVVDEEGNTIVVTTTLGGGFGAGVVAGNTGFLLNNGMRLGSTSPYENNVNFVAPGQIPILNNSPVVVMNNARLWAAFGTPGGETIGQSEFQVLMSLVDYGLGIQEAIEAPRFAVKADPNFYLPGAKCRLQLESRFSQQCLSGLRAMGHTADYVGPYAIGSIQGVRSYDNGAVMAGADPRRMAMAAGW